MESSSIFKRILDKVEDELAYISLRKRLTRCLLLKIEVVLTLVVMMTMMVMMAVHSREENLHYRDGRSDSDDDYEEENTDEYEEDSEDADENNDYNEIESEISEEGTISNLIRNENDNFFEFYTTNVNLYSSDYSLYQNIATKIVHRQSDYV